MTIINVVSGKGGTGKTLISAVLADILSRRSGASVLLIDIDIFVRGLTSLLFYERETPRLLPEGQAATSDVITEVNEGRLDDGFDPGIQRYRTFDIWVSVRRIDDVLNYHDVVPSTFEDAKSRLERLLHAVKKNYDIILLDSRAGFDEFIAASHSISDITVNIADSDMISRITSENLVRQLERAADTPIYRIVNKSIDDNERDVNDIGRIPFDAEIMKSYGRREFWERIAHSVLEVRVAHAWNVLANNEDIKFRFSERNVSNFTGEKIENRMLRFELQERVFVLMSVVFSLVGFLLIVMGNSLISVLSKDPFKMVGIVSMLGGLLVAFSVTLGFVRRR